MKNYKRIAAAVLAVAVSAAATGSIAYAKNTDKSAADTVAAKTNDNAEKIRNTARKSVDGEAYKDETVYVLCKNDSTVKDVVVSDWLKNTPALDSLADISDLTDIENVKGNEEYTQTGNALNWSTKGSDIYYKGKTNKELPVDVKITYFLDGKEISPEDLTGKSGHVTIRWEYTNKQKVTKTINGKKTDIYVPFMTASAAVLDTGKFVNVEVTNGKVISDGNRLIAVGAAFPGLNKSLALDDIKSLDIELPESFEIEADVTDFEMNTSVTVVSNEIFTKLDLDENFDVSDLEDKLTQLRDGANQLTEGTAKLYDGISELSDKSGDLTSGINKLYDGSLSLKNGADELNSGAKQLADGAKTLSDSTGKFTTGIKSAKDGSAQLVNGLDLIKDGSGSLYEGLYAADNGAAALCEGLDSAKSGSDELVAGFTKVNEGAAALSEGAQQLGGGVGSLADGSGQLKGGTAQLADGAGQLAAGAETLSSSAGQLSQGITGAKSGADQLAAGITSAKTGADSLAAGASQLKTGADTLAAGTSQLETGASQLSAGADNLTAGIGTAASSLDTTIAANEQALAALKGLYEAR